MPKYESTHPKMFLDEKAVPVGDVVEVSEEFYKANKDRLKPVVEKEVAPKAPVAAKPVAPAAKAPVVQPRKPLPNAAPAAKAPVAGVSQSGTAG